jgi:hypothetical protein
MAAVCGKLKMAADGRAGDRYPYGCQSNRGAMIMLARYAAFFLLLGISSAAAQTPPLHCGDFRHNGDNRTWELMRQQDIPVNGATLQPGAVFNALISFDGINLGAALDAQCIPMSPDKRLKLN